MCDKMCVCDVMGCGWGGLMIVVVPGEAFVG